MPLSIGIFAGSGVLALAARQPLGLDRPTDYLRVSATGLLWGIGNLGMLLRVDALGAGRGFTISQLSVVVNALIGVFLLKNPAPRSRAAVFILAGSALATLGGAILGNLKCSRLGIALFGAIALWRSPQAMRLFLGQALTGANSSACGPPDLKLHNLTARPETLAPLLRSRALQDGGKPWPFHYERPRSHLSGPPGY